MSEDKPGAWHTLLSGFGQALPAAVIGGIGLLATMLVNVQIQLAELRKDQQQAVMLLNQNRQDAQAIEQRVLDVERKVTILEAK